MNVREVGLLREEVRVRGIGPGNQVGGFDGRTRGAMTMDDLDAMNVDSTEATETERNGRDLPGGTEMQSETRTDAESETAIENQMAKSAARSARKRRRRRSPRHHNHPSR